MGSYSRCVHDGKSLRSAYYTVLFLSDFRALDAGGQRRPRHGALIRHQKPKSERASEGREGASEGREGARAREGREREQGKGGREGAKGVTLGWVLSQQMTIPYGRSGRGSCTGRLSFAGAL